jgi:hypothetical protein
MLSSSATANDSTVNRNVIATTRAGIMIQRSRFELASAMLLGYTIRAKHPAVKSAIRARLHTLQYCHVAKRVGDHPQSGGDRAK